MNIRRLMTRNAADGVASKAVQRLAELAKKPQRREVELGTVDLEARTVELSFSSEVEYERWFGIEVLGHDAHEIRMGRIQDSAAALWNHNWDDQRGVVEPGSVRIDTDRKGRAVIRFSKSAAGEQLMQDVHDRIVTKVSVGYMVHGLKLVEERGDIDVYRVTDWEPYEISFVSVPADNTVGVGRTAEKPPEETPPKEAETSPSIEIPAATRTITKDQNQMEKQYRYFRDARGFCKVEQDKDGNDVGQAVILEAAGAERTAGTAQERARTDGIMGLADSYAPQLPQARELSAKFIKEGKSPEEFQRALLDEFGKRSNTALSEQSQAGGGELGMSEADVRRYSLANVIRALANPQDAAAQKAAAFEIECGVAFARTVGKTAKGILVPPDVLSRAMSTTQQGAGATFVDTSKMSMIDLLRNRAVMMQMATVIGGLVGNVDIPKQVSDGQAYWLGEGQDATETGFTVGQISFSPKTVGAYTDITRRLLQQPNQAVDSLVRADLMRALGTAIDKAGIYGTGSDYQPTGLKLTKGINGVDLATQQQPTFAEFVKMETEIAADNADVGSMAYLMHSRIRGHAKTTAKMGSGTESTIWEPGNTVNGYRTEITNQLNADDIFFGNWADFLIMLWGGLDITVDPYTLSKSGGLRIVAFQDVDMGVRRAESFCWASHLYA
jgi:HK97 family phage major capsid protein/HK97 family phage prohead protease